MNGLKVGTDCLKAEHILGSHRGPAPIRCVIRGFTDFFASLDKDSFGLFDGLKVRLELRDELICFKKCKHSLRIFLISIFSHNSSYSLALCITVNFPVQWEEGVIRKATGD